MTGTSLFFDPQLSSDARGMTVNNFRQVDMSEISELILRPAFQRNLVWNPDQKSFLIDSILRGLPVPELYVQIVTSAEGAERLTVVDGQQRISTCLDFAEGRLRLGNSDDLDAGWRGKAFSELETDLKAKFLGFKFIVRELPISANDAVLREIFRRLNRTVEALVAQELRHAAFTGPFIQLVERGGAAAALSDLGVFTPKDYQRRRNDEFVAEALLAIDAKAFPNKKEGLDELFITFERRGVPSEQLSEMTRRFGRAVSFLDFGSAKLRKSRFRNKSDCYSLIVFLARNAENISTDEMNLDAIVDKLVDFSTLVNEIKRLEGKGQSVDELVSKPTGQEALSYLRAVERAASDRLSRVRRNEALKTLLKTDLAASPVRPLSESDEQWTRVEDQLEESADETDDDEERQTVQDSLLADG
ncbi:hypothetical protein Q075_04278 [Mycobacterium numidiamassiliense]|uniref:GmrSD restriction endonucleases N-terminal domain-containing protein n=1 Tax=Mycobacterium numidiamassiliense TaxID=1841861 RepID=A0A2U3PEC4_9MYCO|nr:DUF262 domain-containing protein [Mycobacterium numidiamassiliense]SPM42070.1 hypothetical protein Q075_04278 [Mycobacterium numidiamassiliense]